MIDYNQLKPLVEFIVKKYFRKYEDVQDHTQVALIKIYEISKKQSDLHIDTKQSRSFLRKVVRNLMVDILRKKKADSLAIAERTGHERDDFGRHLRVDTDAVGTQSNTFENLACAQALEELKHFLDPIETLILNEMLHPSEDFCWYERQKKTVHRMYAKSINRGCLRFDQAGRRQLVIENYDEEIAGFLQIDEKTFIEKTSNIKTIFENLSEASL